MENLGESSDRVMRWKLLLDKYDSTFKYIRGVDNIVADAISRLDYCPKKNPYPEKQTPLPTTKTWRSRSGTTAILFSATTKRRLRIWWMMR